MPDNDTFIQTGTHVRNGYFWIEYRKDGVILERHERGTPSTHEWYRLEVTWENGIPDEQRELRDTNNDGIPDAVAEANPRLPQLALLNVLNENLSDEVASRINIGPVLRDSSGDGLLDNEAIDVEYEVFEENNQLKLRTRVTDAKAHPGRFDTDSDGLSDYSELKDWDTSPWQADTSRDGLNDMVDPRPHEKTLPPEFEYQTQDLHDFTLLPTTLITTRDDLVVAARPAGAANDIEEIRIHQYINTWLPFAGAVKLRVRRPCVRMLNVRIRPPRTS